MIDAIWLPTVVAIVLWLAGFNVLRHLAARAVERERGPGTLVGIVLSGAWRQGQSASARRWRNLAIAWFVLGPVVIVVALASWAVGR